MYFHIAGGGTQIINFTELLKYSNNFLTLMKDS